MTDSKTKLWDAVCTTNPEHTKTVNVRGGFTAIDAMYQVQNATAQFGPAGVGWGFDFELSYPPNDTIIAKVTLWHGKKDQTVTQCGQKALKNDEDAAKKAVTDGLTKCLSYLGFNADVFLGKFDDNKYIESMKIEHNPKLKAFREWTEIAIVDLGNIKDAKELAAWLKTNKETVDDAIADSMTKAAAMSVMSQYSSVKAEFEPDKKEEAA